FTLLLPNATRDAPPARAHLNAALSATRAAGFEGISASAGLADTRDTTDPPALLALADQRMYEEKNGRKAVPGR
ncbi:MAG TPA: hypothetical protein VHN99_04035, partial [Deinococcales bacterium]|nr:hypothetical protein [Deinococcales bacterium]